MTFNINYFLEEHGWSNCLIKNKSKSCEIIITHAFAFDPIEECLSALIGLIKGEKERTFIWYGEPGGNKVSITEIPLQKHIVQFHIESFEEDYGEEIKNYTPRISFNIKKIQLVRIFYFEFKKNSELLKDKDYEKNRKGTFPFMKFLQFEKLATAYIKLK